MIKVLQWIGLISAIISTLLIAYIPVFFIISFIEYIMGYSSPRLITSVYLFIVNPVVGVTILLVALVLFTISLTIDKMKLS